MLIDAHIHISLNGRDFAASRKMHQTSNNDIIKNQLNEYKKLGIYLLRDGGDNLNISFRAREIAREEGMILRTPVYAIYKRGTYGSFLGKPITDLDEFDQEFKNLLRFQPDHLKIILTGLADFNSFGKIDGIAFHDQQLYHMVQSAKDKDLPVMVHANSAKAVQMAVRAGADTIEHGYYLGEEELYQMAEQGTIWIPTLAPIGNLIAYNDSRHQSQMDNILKIYESQTEKVIRANQIGVKIAVGSDAGSRCVNHGQGFWDEVFYLTQAGLKKEEVLKDSFVNGIQALGLRKDELDCCFKDVNNVINPGLEGM
ncbi:MAG: amidohydrolase family protein [Peptococcaceae bacterium]|nr:amidohydrolase family protein [Peptococcaceae bacterium]